MKNPKGELARIATADGLELHGLFYEPETKTKKVVIHIHGWTGNFYENVFLDYIGKACLINGYSFLSFNTRGAGHVQEFLKKKNNSVEYVKIGGSLENFKDCLIDIRGSLSFLEEKGYTDFVLEGHSTGCQKHIYYVTQTKDARVKGLIFLEPADDPSIVKRFLGERRDEATTYARNLIANGKPNNPMPSWVPFGVELAAQKFMSIADPNSIEGNLLYLQGDLHKIKKIPCPVLIISAEHSEYQDAISMQQKLRENIPICETHIISNSKHWFFGHEEEIGQIINAWLRKKIS
jgi:pimeloyl-ACP methyl ester carboxylesterase